MSMLSTLCIIWKLVCGYNQNPSEFVTHTPLLSTNKAVFRPCKTENCLWCLNLFFDLFQLFFDLYRFNVRFRSVWADLKAAHFGFETHDRHHQKSKIVVSVAPQKGLISSKHFFFKKQKLEQTFCFSLCNFYFYRITS